MNAAKSPLAKSPSVKKSPFPSNDCASNASTVNSGTPMVAPDPVQTPTTSVKYTSSTSVNATRLLRYSSLHLIGFNESRTCLLVCISFLVCWFPFACINPLKSYYPGWFTEEVGRVLQEFSIWLGWINSGFGLNKSLSNIILCNKNSIYIKTIISVQSCYLLLRSWIQAPFQIVSICRK